MKKILKNAKLCFKIQKLNNGKYRYSKLHLYQLINEKNQWNEDISSFKEEIGKHNVNIKENTFKILNQLDLFYKNEKFEQIKQILSIFQTDYSENSKFWVNFHYGMVHYLQNNHLERSNSFQLALKELQSIQDLHEINLDENTKVIYEKFINSMNLFDIDKYKAFDLITSLFKDMKSIQKKDEILLMNAERYFEDLFYYQLSDLTSSTDENQWRPKFKDLIDTIESLDEFDYLKESLYYYYSLKLYQTLSIDGTEFYLLKALGFLENDRSPSTQTYERKEEILYSLSTFYFEQGNFQTCKSYILKINEIPELSQTARNRYYFIYSLFHYFQKDFKSSKENIEQIKIDIIDDPILKRNILSQKSLIYLFNRDYKEARDIYKDFAQYFDNLSDVKAFVNNINTIEKYSKNENFQDIEMAYYYISVQRYQDALDTFAKIDKVLPDSFLKLNLVLYFSKVSISLEILNFMKDSLKKAQNFVKKTFQKNKKFTKNELNGIAVLYSYLTKIKPEKNVELTSELLGFIDDHSSHLHFITIAKLATAHFVKHDYKEAMEKHQIILENPTLEAGLRLESSIQSCECAKRLSLSNEAQDYLNQGLEIANESGNEELIQRITEYRDVYFSKYENS